MKTKVQIILKKIRRRLKKRVFKKKFKQFGSNSFIEAPFYLSNSSCIEIGNNVDIRQNIRLEAVKQYGNSAFNPKIVIGNDVTINQNFHCTCAEEIVIGNGTSITANVGIFDIIHPYEDITINPRKQEIKTKKVHIGENCLIGMNSVILPGTQLGKHTIVGACSVVSGTFPDYVVIAGSPAKIIKQYNTSNGIWEKIKE